MQSELTSAMKKFKKLKKNVTERKNEINRIKRLERMRDNTNDAVDGRVLKYFCSIG